MPALVLVLGAAGAALAPALPAPLELGALGMPLAAAALGIFGVAPLAPAAAPLAAAGITFELTSVPAPRSNVVTGPAPVELFSL
ncbi:MAG TPA: hypothetical protein VFG30_26770 [Polyangiales bacterium]|nr:hypothetical protein [Polyangiales bacterium]